MSGKHDAGPLTSTGGKTRIPPPAYSKPDSSRGHTDIPDQCSGETLVRPRGTVRLGASRLPWGFGISGQNSLCSTPLMASSGSSASDRRIQQLQNLRRGVCEQRVVHVHPNRRSRIDRAKCGHSVGTSQLSRLVNLLPIDRRGDF